MKVRALILLTLLFFGNPFVANSKPTNLDKTENINNSFVNKVQYLQLDASLSDSDAYSEEEQEVENDYIFSLGQKWRGVINPGRDLYPRYIADPIRPGMSISRLMVTDSDISEAGDTRYTIRLGGHWGFLRIHPKGEPDRGFQLDMEAAFLGQFDADYSLDNIGWDGLWGVLLTWANGKGVAAKLATQHDSSHVGDEFAERTGRKRINYTRAELVFGVSGAFLKHWRLYGEAGYGYDLRNDELQEPWRVKGGLEFEDANRFWKGRAGYYAAIDVTATEELDWQRDITIQTGFVLPVGGLARAYRLGVEYRNGRSIIGEFFQNNETYWAVGFWMGL